MKGELARGLRSLRKEKHCIARIKFIIKTVLLTAAATALVFVSTGTNAAANLISAAVTGSNGATIWNTTSATRSNTVFVQQPIGNVMNPEGQALNDPTENGTQQLQHQR